MRRADLVLQSQVEGKPIYVLRGFTDGTMRSLTVASATDEQANTFAKHVAYRATVDTKVWRSEWAVPLADLGVKSSEKGVLPSNLTAYRSEDDVYAQLAGTLGETWDLALGGRLMLNWDAKRQHRPTLAVPRVPAIPTGDVWPGQAAELAQTPAGAPLHGAACSTSVVRCGADLHVRVDVSVKAPGKLTNGQQWCTDDGAEVCIRGKTPDGKPATWVVHGFANGSYELSDEAGAPDSANATARPRITYTAARTRTGWRAQWRLPLQVLGVDTGANTPFNIGVFRTEDRQWINWVGTGSQTWKLENAGGLRWQ